MGWRNVVVRGIRGGGILGAAYIVNVQVLTWFGLGLTGWVFAIDLTLLVSVVVLGGRGLSRAGGRVSGTGVGLLWVGTVVLVSGLLQQLYMVVYLTWIHPGWVDEVMAVRRQLLLDNGVSPESISRRIEAARSGFRSMTMLTRGVAVPGLWKLAVAGVALLATGLIRSRRPHTTTAKPEVD